jgi:hypothetical protein
MPDDEELREEQTEAQLVPCWHCGDDVPIDTADVHLAAHGPEWVCQECGT